MFRTKLNPLTRCTASWVPLDNLPCNCFHPPILGNIYLAISVNGASASPPTAGESLVPLTSLHGAPFPLLPTWEVSCSHHCHPSVSLAPLKKSWLASRILKLEKNCYARKNVKRIPCLTVAPSYKVAPFIENFAELRQLGSFPHKSFHILPLDWSAFLQSLVEFVTSSHISLSN